MQRKEIILRVLCAVFFVAIIVVIAVGVKYKKENKELSYDDGIKYIDANTIQLGNKKTTVEFSKVLLGAHNEQRKLIVSTQNANVSTTYTYEIIEGLSWQATTKSQEVSYNGTGYFVVDLAKLSEENIIDDKENKVLTIKVEHPYLETVDVDPEKVSVGDVREGFFARGDIKITLKDYVEIEKVLLEKMESEFNTIENGQKADEKALEMVKEVYEPIVKAIDDKYEVRIEFLPRQTFER